MITRRLSLPLLESGQAQKDVTHNEALAILDCLVKASVFTPSQDTPPQIPVSGATYLCGANPTGLWEGKAHHLACFCEGGWRFVSPSDGLTFTSAINRECWTFASGNWQRLPVAGTEVRVQGLKVVGSQMAAIPAPTGGATTDTQARAAIDQILTALRSHGLIAT